MADYAHDNWVQVGDVMTLRTGDMILVITDHQDGRVTVAVEPQVEGLALVEPAVHTTASGFEIALAARALVAGMR
jgi:hypothetical protein